MNHMHDLDNVSERIISQYKLAPSYRVTVISFGLEEIDGADTDISDAIDRFQSDGYFPQDAVNKALQEKIVKSMPPGGFMFVRLTAEDLSPITIMVPNHIFEKQ